jgi:hypothetical protein
VTRDVRRCELLVTLMRHFSEFYCDELVYLFEIFGCKDSWPNELAAGFEIRRPAKNTDGVASSFPSCRSLIRPGLSSQKI